MRRRSETTRAVRRVLLLLSVAGAACADRADERDTIAEATITAEDTSGSAAESATPVPHPDLSDDPFRLYGLEPETTVADTIITMPVWLVNRSSGSVVVAAYGGSTRVVLDTVPGRDSVFIRIRTRADSVELTARTLGGAERGRRTVPVASTGGRVAFPPKM